MNAGAHAPGRLAETPDLDGAYPRLSDAQLAALAPHGERRPTRREEVLFHEGQTDYDFFIVLAGLVEIVEGPAGDRRTIAVHGPGRFLGELSLLTGQAAFFSAVVVAPGEVLQIPVQAIRGFCAQDSALGDLILRALLLRRERLVGLGAGLRIVGSHHQPQTRALRDFAARNRLPHRWIDVETDPDAERLLEALGVAPEETPIVIWKGQVLRNPSVGELARAVGLPATARHEDVCDLAVVGCGPTGLAAAVYGASEGLTTVALDAIATGGQASTSSRIENYLGFPTGISGAELAERASIQAAKFGARLMVPAEAVGLEARDGHHTLRLSDGLDLHARSVLIATGARYRRLPVERLEQFEGAGVWYAATLTEAHVCAGHPVAVVGGGNSAGQATVFLARHATTVHLLVREDSLDANMSRYLADRIVRMRNVDVQLCTVATQLLGQSTLEGVVVEQMDTGRRTRLDVRNLFVFIGADPRTEWLADRVVLDERGYVLTGPDALATAPRRDGASGDGGDGSEHAPMLLETSVRGVFAAGDVRSGSTRRVASGVGEGAMAVRLVHEHLADRTPAAMRTLQYERSSLSTGA